MKLTKYITTVCIAALFSGCDYLDFDETTGMTKEEMYSYFGNVTSLSTFAYGTPQQTTPYTPGIKAVCIIYTTEHGVRSKL